MRALALAAGACLAAAACSTGRANPAPSPDVHVAKATVRGTVTYPLRIALAKTAIVNVDVIDGLAAGPSATPLASVRVATLGRQPPFEFSLTVDSADLRPDGAYGVVATLEAGGETFFTSPRPVPVLTQGHPTTATVVLVPVGSTGAPAVATLAFECSSDADDALHRVTVRLWADSAAVVSPDGTARLAAAESSPFAYPAVTYTDGATTRLWRGASAAVTAGSRSWVRCRSDPARAGRESTAHTPDRQEER